ncbi:Hypothetical predicted protein [Cloeon dipterum]|uniref:Uncharacterized protein n=1 Tax=Cloeon dipterum TaxID=197152 RepID=A0A8S1CIW0_9INSE|nr:Hypothetical predicted protein [Cloeon dipterum]
MSLNSSRAQLFSSVRPSWPHSCREHECLRQTRLRDSRHSPGWHRLHDSQDQPVEIESFPFNEEIIVTSNRCLHLMVLTFTLSSPISRALSSYVLTLASPVKFGASRNPYADLACSISGVN